MKNHGGVGRVPNKGVWARSDDLLTLLHSKVECEVVSQNSKTDDPEQATEDVDDVHQSKDLLGPTPLPGKRRKWTVKPHDLVTLKRGSDEKNHMVQR